MMGPDGVSVSIQERDAPNRQCWMRLVASPSTGYVARSAVDHRLPLGQFLVLQFSCLWCCSLSQATASQELGAESRLVF